MYLKYLRIGDEGLLITLRRTPNYSVTNLPQKRLISQIGKVLIVTRADRVCGRT